MPKSIIFTDIGQLSPLAINDYYMQFIFDQIMNIDTVDQLYVGNWLFISYIRSQIALGVIKSTDVSLGARSSLFPDQIIWLQIQTNGAIVNTNPEYYAFIASLPSTQVDKILVGDINRDLLPNPTVEVAKNSLNQ